MMCALLFLAWTAERNGDPLLYNSMWRSPLGVFAPLFDSLPGLHQPAWNLLLLAMVPACYLRPGALRRRAWPMDAAILLSIITIACAFLWGMLRGGSAYWAYYQLNGLLLTLLAGLVLLAAVRSPRDVKALGTTIVAAAVVRSGLALYFFFTFVRGHEPYPPHMTSHDDSPLFVAGILLLLCWALVRARWRTWIPVVLLVLTILAAMKTNNRRIAWIELVAGLVFLYLLLQGRGLRRRVNRRLLLTVPVIAIYAIVGWGRPGALFAPLRAFDSTAGPNADASTMARNEENLNLILTYIQHPVVGSGWGHPMTSVSSYYAYFGGFDVMYPYTPHNSLAALLAFAGLVGLFGTLLVIPVAAFLAARACRFAVLRVDRMATMAAVCYLPVYGVHAYGDIGLQSVTSGLLLSVALAVAGRASVWTGAWPDGRRLRRAQPSLPPVASSESDRDATASGHGTT
jgi:hypothetical protein